MMTTTILRIAIRLIVPLSLVFAFFIYFKGHQTPGGGFVGGLVTAVAFVVYRMSEGGASLDKLLPWRERTFIAIGLALALGTGVAAMAFGLPFLTSNHGYVPLPGLEHMPGKTGMFEWATVMTFDLGVMFVVTGVVVGMINGLSRELD